MFLAIVLDFWPHVPLLVVWMASAAPAPSATEIGLTLCGMLTVTSPLWLRAAPWTGAQMTAASYIVALIIAIIASWLAGDLTFDRAGVLSVLSGSGSVWTVQQLLYAALKQARPGWVGAEPNPLPPVPGKPTPTP